MAQKVNHDTSLGNFDLTINKKVKNMMRYLLKTIRHFSKTFREGGSLKQEFQIIVDFDLIASICDLFLIFKN